MDKNCGVLSRRAVQNRKSVDSGKSDPLPKFDFKNDDLTLSVSTKRGVSYTQHLRSPQTGLKNGNAIGLDELPSGLLKVAGGEGAKFVAYVQNARGLGKGL